MKVADYLAETRAELKHVVWPTRRQAIVFTAVVVLITVSVSAFLGVLDSLFQFLIARILG